ncbi:hypothetical_protein_-_conserved [Leishmania major strain Friedlin]|nr:hypothetical_protein_-_conserved [Leishmania major strain Friedlin]
MAPNTVPAAVENGILRHIGADVRALRARRVCLIFRSACGHCGLEHKDGVGKVAKSAAQKEGTPTAWITGLVTGLRRQVRHPPQPRYTRRDKIFLAAVVPHQMNKNAELTKRPENVRGRPRTCWCSHVGFLQRRVRGGGKTVCCPLPSWYCGAPSPLVPCDEGAAYQALRPVCRARDSWIARGPKHTSLHAMILHAVT